MALVGQTITIVNKSGKVVSTSKHLVNVFNEAKTAYSERKAELKAARREKSDKKDDERKTRKRIETLKLSDDDESSLSRRSSRCGSEDGRRSNEIRRKPVARRSERPPIERGVSDSFYANDPPPTSRRSSHHRPSPLSRQHSATTEDPHVRELTRRHTSGLELTSPTNNSRRLSRRASADDIDMDLAYGSLPPPLPERNYDTEIELRSKMSGLQRVLEEANCLQHSVTAIIDNLQKNPDALAAVALTLAEISSLVSKMAPGALMSLKGAFPAVVALLASPQFMIAAGVGVGVTIVVLGGYKIVKKIQAKKEAENGLLLEAYPAGEGLVGGGVDRESEMESLRELSRIEQWRRGIAEVEAESVGTSVEGEYVTPGAKTALLLEGKVTEADFKAKDKKKKKKHRSRSEVSGSTSASGTKVKSKKEPSGLRMLFKGRSEKNSGL